MLSSAPVLESFPFIKFPFIKPPKEKPFTPTNLQSQTAAKLLQYSEGEYWREREQAIEMCCGSGKASLTLEWEILQLD